MSVPEEFTGETELTIITPLKVIVIGIVIVVALKKNNQGSFSIVVDGRQSNTQPSTANDGVAVEFSFTVGGFASFENKDLIEFTTAYQQDKDDVDSLQIGSGVIDIRKLAKCKYISIELSTHSLKQGDKSFSSVFVARKLKKRLK